MEFNIYTREAGGGKLSVSVEGPSKAKLEVVDRGHGYSTVSYTVAKEGTSSMHIFPNLPVDRFLLSWLQIMEMVLGHIMSPVLQ